MEYSLDSGLQQIRVAMLYTSRQPLKTGGEFNPVRAQVHWKGE
jgi:hypothetical protein